MLSRYELENQSIASEHAINHNLDGTYILNRGSTIRFSVPHDNVNYTFMVSVLKYGFYYGADPGAKVPEYTELMENVSPYDFEASSMSVIISLSMCCVVIWSIFVAALLSRKGRPILQVLTFLYVAIIITLHFGLGFNYYFHQNTLGYLSSRDWFKAKFTGSDALSALLLSCFTLVLVVEIQLLRMLVSHKWWKRIILFVGAAFVVVDTVLWGMAYTESWDSHGLPYYLEVWSGFELGMQAIMFIFVVIWAVSCYRFAFSLPTLGVAVLSLLGCAAPIVTTSFNFSSSTYYIYLVATLCARCWACMLVCTWTSSVKHNMLKERKVGDLGALISRNSARTYNFSGNGTASGDTTNIARLESFLTWPFGSSYHIRSVTVEERDRCSFESLPADPGPVHTYPLRTMVPDCDSPDYEEASNPLFGSPGVSPSPPVPGSSTSVPGPSNSPPPILGPGPSTIPGSSTPLALPGIDEVVENEEELQEELPGFVPHPRFHRGDYWDEKRNMHF